MILTVWAWWNDWEEQLACNLQWNQVYLECAGMSGNLDLVDFVVWVADIELAQSWVTCWLGEERIIQVFMKLPCEFHLSASQLTAASFSAVLKQYLLNLLFWWILWWCCGLCLWWLVLKTEFFSVNGVNVCSPVACWSWISNIGAPGWKGTVLLPASKLQLSVSFRGASSHPVEVI